MFNDIIQFMKGWPFNVRFIIIAEVIQLLPETISEQTVLKRIMVVNTNLTGSSKPLILRGISISMNYSSYTTGKHMFENY